MKARACARSATLPTRRGLEHRAGRKPGAESDVLKTEEETLETDAAS